MVCCSTLLFVGLHFSLKIAIDFCSWDRTAPISTLPASHYTSKIFLKLVRINTGIVHNFSLIKVKLFSASSPHTNLSFYCRDNIAEIPNEISLKYSQTMVVLNITKCLRCWLFSDISNLLFIYVNSL